jgi:regulator of protease activity HflC (stomatin/prohibitin superfamily)
MLDELKYFLWQYMYWIIAIIAIAIASQSFYIANDGFIGIQRTFGQIHDRVLTAGINIKTPFTIVKEMRIADSTISYDGSTIADTINQMHEPSFKVYNKTDTTSGSGTNIEVEARPTIVYSLNPNTAPQLIRTMGANWQMTYMRQVMQDALQKATADLDLSSPHITVESLKSKIESLLVKLFNERGDYVKLINVNIDYTLPKEVIAAGVSIYESRQGLIRANSEQEKVAVELQTAWNVAENNAKIAAMKVIAPINSVVQYFVSLGFSNEESVEKAMQLLQIQGWNGQVPLIISNGDTSPAIAPIFSYPLKPESQLDK